MPSSTPIRPRFGSSLPLAALPAALVLVLSACASATSASPTASQTAAAASAAPSAQASAEVSASEPAAGAVELTVSDTGAGQSLAGDGGLTLYVFDTDTAGQSACNAGCVENWPPLTVEVTAGAGVTGEIGSITRDDGSAQVTYNGRPLYYYAGDQAAGDANGDGLGGVWHIAAP